MERDTAPKASSKQIALSSLLKSAEEGAQSVPSSRLTSEKMDVQKAMSKQTALTSLSKSAVGGAEKVTSYEAPTELQKAMSRQITLANLPRSAKEGAGSASSTETLIGELESKGAMITKIPLAPLSQPARGETEKKTAQREIFKANYLGAIFKKTKKMEAQRNLARQISAGNIFGATEETDDSCSRAVTEDVFKADGSEADESTGAEPTEH